MASPKDSTLRDPTLQTISGISEETIRALLVGRRAVKINCSCRTAAVSRGISLALNQARTTSRLSACSTPPTTACDDAPPTSPAYSMTAIMRRNTPAVYHPVSWGWGLSEVNESWLGRQSPTDCEPFRNKHSSKRQWAVRQDFR